MDDITVRLRYFASFIRENFTDYGYAPDDIEAAAGIIYDLREELKVLEDYKPIFDMICKDHQDIVVAATAKVRMGVS
tara:strand:- start:419 stop:649 length:231 start_codon:yes stop_codon:yes gene_type:complete